MNEMGPRADGTSMNGDPSEIAATPEPSQEGVSIVRWLVETALLVLVAFIVAQGVRTYVMQPFVIPSGSMVPTIEIGNRVLAEKIAFRYLRDPRQGDIVVFDDPNGQHPQLIKRVIALEGQMVEVRGDAVYVDGELLDEPYVHGRPTTPGSVALPVVVPQGHIWLMGDNRPNSGDSRYFGSQPLSSVRGRAFWTYWPLEAFGSLD